jgi:23S rRNA pseudouridine1911/1915/1917 synthase
VERPGIVHRLDAETSGCLVVAKNDAAHLSLASQFRRRSVQKIYLAIVAGEPRANSGRIETLIGRHTVHRKKMAVSKNASRGKPAVTEWKLRERLGAAALVEFNLLTGRTHQIRVHAAHMGHPILGDKLYGKAPASRLAERQQLHAWRLSLRHPCTGKPIAMEAPLPEDMKATLSLLRNKI